MPHIEFDCAECEANISVEYTISGRYHWSPWSFDPPEYPELEFVSITHYDPCSHWPTDLTQLSDAQYNLLEEYAWDDAETQQEQYDDPRDLEMDYQNDLDY